MAPQAYPKQEAIRAGELVIPNGLVHDQHTAHESHDEGDHPCSRHLAEGKEQNLVQVSYGQASLPEGTVPKNWSWAQYRCPYLHLVSFLKVSSETKGLGTVFLQALICWDFVNIYDQVN